MSGWMRPYGARKWHYFDDAAKDYERAKGESLCRYWDRPDTGRPVVELAKDQPACEPCARALNERETKETL